MNESRVFSLSRLTKLWSIGFAAWKQQVLYDFTVLAILILLFALSAPIALVLINHDLEAMLPILYNLVLFTIALPMFGKQFCKNWTCFWRPQDLSIDTNSRGWIIEDDNAWGDPGKLHEWFKAWSRGLISFLITSIPRFLISLPLIVIGFTFLMSALIRKSATVIIMSGTSLLLWTIASPILTAVICTWLIRKVFPIWELETLFQTHYLRQDLLQGVRKRVHGQKGRYSIRLCRRNRTRKVVIRQSNKLAAE